MLLRLYSAATTAPCGASTCSAHAAPSLQAPEAVANKSIKAARRSWSGRKWLPLPRTACAGARRAALRARCRRGRVAGQACGEARAAAVIQAPEPPAQAHYEQDPKHGCKSLPITHRRVATLRHTFPAPCHPTCHPPVHHSPSMPPLGRPASPPPLTASCNSACCAGCGQAHCAPGPAPSGGGGAGLCEARAAGQRERQQRQPGPRL